MGEVNKLFIPSNSYWDSVRGFIPGIVLGWIKPKLDLVSCPDHTSLEENGLVNGLKPTKECIIIA